MGWLKGTCYYILAEQLESESWIITSNKSIGTLKMWNITWNSSHVLGPPKLILRELNYVDHYIEVEEAIQYFGLNTKWKIHFTYLRFFYVFSWCWFTIFQDFWRTTLGTITHISYDRIYYEIFFLTNEKKKSPAAFCETLSTMNYGVILKSSGQLHTSWKVKAKLSEWPNQCCKCLDDQYPNIAKITVNAREDLCKI